MKINKGISKNSVFPLLILGEGKGEVKFLLVFPHNFSFIIFLFFFVFTVFISKAQDKNLNDLYLNKNSVRAVFYNTENLFDVFNDSITDDDDYTAKSPRNWNYQRYTYKINSLAKILLAVGEWEAPAFIGLAEIENSLVLSDLTKKTSLKNFNYNFIHFDSPDIRGMDVALLFRYEFFKPLNSKPLKINAFKTRDILYVKGLLLNKDTLHIYINHWSSKRGDSHLSQYKRNTEAALLRKHSDSLFTINPNALILIMGDFNEQPSDTALRYILAASDKSDKLNNKLINLMSQNFNSSEWSYIYNFNNLSQKYLFDQIIISSALYNNKSKAIIFKPDYLFELYNDEKIPFKTYNGYKYNKGFSDHLPVSFTLY
ncbi:MAG: hypothetical protein KA792_00345 [Bacteroidales bacterium]|nr:hypothetical protein [Bacteroidales bacterium]